MLLRLIGFLTGYVTVAITGGSPERFMNLCAVKRRDLWDFKAGKDGLTVRVRVSEYKNLRTAARQTGVHLHILSKHGLPFWFYQHRKRYGLVTGVLLFFVLLQLLCGRVWGIEVKGLDRLEEGYVLSALEEVGIRQGAGVDAFDWASVRQQILAQYKEISWMSLNPVGTVLYVDISEATAPPEKMKETQPCNLVATADGQIVEMQVNVGNPMVKVGDAVVKGDVLVSGAVEYADGCTLLRHASGKIIANTTHRVSFDVPLKQTHSQPVDKTRVRRVLRFFGLDIPLYLGSVKGDYEKTVTSAVMTVAGTRLPISLETAYFREVRPVTVTLREEEAIAEGKELVDGFVAENLAQAEILNITYDSVLSQGIIKIRAEIFCKENIGIEENMLIF